MKQLLQKIRETAELTRYIQEKTQNNQFQKENRTPVTVADFAAQAYIGRDWHSTFSDAPLVSEEGVESLKKEENQNILEQITEALRTKYPDADSRDVLKWIDRGNQDPDTEFWTLDPIDGTKGFIRGDQYAIALAHIQNGTVQTAVIACPNLTDARTEDPGGPGTLVFAQKGEGSWQLPLFEEGEKKQLSVSECDQPQDAVILRSFESAHTNEELMSELRNKLETSEDPWPMDSQAKYAVLAAGGGDILYRLLSKKKPDYKEYIWDQAPGSLILSEAGGKLTDLHGKPLDFSTGLRLVNNTGVLATNGILHEKALEVHGEATAR